MFQVPNTDLLAALARVSAEGSAAARGAAHRRCMEAARRKDRRAAWAGLWRALLAYMPRKAGKASEIQGT